MSRHRSWTITVNNPTEQDEHQLKAQECRSLFIVYGREKGESGTPHLQGYIQLKNSQTLEYMKKHVHATAHFEVARGTPLQNYTYCTKDGDYWTFGEVPKQGKRTDIDEVKSILKDGGTMKDIVEIATSYQATKFAEIYLKYTEKPRRGIPVEVHWFYGPSGSGKSTAADIEYPDAYYKDNTIWWDGYDGQKTVIIDEWRQKDWDLTYLLRMWQPLPMRIQTKGSTKELQATVFIVTTIEHPDTVSYSTEDMYQFMRRITNIRQFHPRPGGQHAIVTENPPDRAAR